jgi:Bacterial Ig-like domain
MKPVLRSLCLLPALAAGCSESSNSQLASRLLPGVTFTYPLDGQVDVPVQARLLFQFTDPVDTAALGAACTVENGVPQGTLCVLGEEGAVAMTTEVLGEKGTIVVATSTQLRPGQTYEIYVRPGLLAGAGNLSADAPLVTFRTRRSDSAPGAPQLIAVNGESPRSFGTGTGGAADAPRLSHPVLDHTTLRLVFSEALDERSLTPGTSVTLRRTDGAGSPDNAGVAMTVLLQGQHMTVDPDTKLEAGGTYDLKLTGLTDRSGAALPATTLTFVPETSATYEQTVEIDHPGAAGGSGAEVSAMTGAPFNSVVKRSPLIGTAILGVLPGTLRVELGDPGKFGGPIPFLLPKGQRLAASELALKLAGVIGLGYRTGSLSFDLISDANGWVTRNVHRPATERPDDRESPLLVDLYFDAALTAEDPTGNALATQSLLNIHLTGEASSVDGQLVMEAAGAIEVELIGVSRSTADLSLRLRTGAAPIPSNIAAPTLISSAPARGETDVALDVHPQVLLSNAVDLGKVVSAGQLKLTSAAGTTAVSLRASGGVLAVIPRAPLLAGTTYTLTLGSLVDVSGASVMLTANDASGGTGAITFTTAGIPGGNAVAPQLAAMIPGVACPLSGATATTPGHCTGGANGDLPYQPFQLPADRGVVARFTQPMSAATMRVGTACGQGAIRVEALSAAGACTAVVAGELTVGMSGFRFQPSAPLTVGQRYRVTLTPGTNNNCDPTTELCGANGRPFNSDPLEGVGDAGGPPVILTFTATAPTGDTLVTLIGLATALITDRNANGTIDPGEGRKLPNELAVDVASTGGFVSAASVTGPDCQPAMPGNQVCLGVMADLPVQVLPAMTSCPIDVTGAPTTSGGPCVPIRISAQAIRTTSLTIQATATVLGQNIDLSNVQTGMMHLRILEPTAGGAVGYIMSDANDKPIFVISAATYMDAPDLSILGGLVSHDVRSKPVNVTLAGPVTFLSDGRMQVVLHNRGNVLIPVNISTLGIDGRITLRVPDGTLSLTLNTPSLH